MYHYLEIPFMEIEKLKENYKLTPIKGGITLYKGNLIPRELRKYKSKDYSYARWLEDERNSIVLPTEKRDSRIELNNTQKNNIDKIVQSYNNDYSNFLVLDKDSRNGNIISINALKQIAENNIDDKNKSKILIVTDASTLTNWRELLYTMPEINLYARVLLIDYKSINKVISSPPQARITNNKKIKNEQKTTKGTTAISWDMIIFDAANNITNMNKNLAKQAVIIGELNKNYVKDHNPFVIFNTNKIGKTPLDINILARIFSDKISGNTDDKNILIKDWEVFLKKNNFSVDMINDKWKWGVYEHGNTESKIKASDRQAKDIKLINSIIQNPNTPVINNNVHGSKYNPLYIELSALNSEKFSKIYSTVKTKYSKDKDNVDDAIREYKSRTAFLEVDATVSFIQESYYKGENIIVSVSSFNLLKEYYEKLTKKKLSVLVYQDHNNDSNVISSFGKKSKILLTTSSLSKVDSKITNNIVNPTIIVTDFMDTNGRLKMSVFNKTFISPIFYLPTICYSFEDDITNLIIHNPSSNINGKITKMFTQNFVKRKKLNMLT